MLLQTAVDCIVNPPKSFEPSHYLFEEEKAKILEDLAVKAELVQKSFSQIPGIDCQPIQGAMYAFPRVNIPSKAIELAKGQDMEPDVFYALELLESTGISVVPGSGVGQLPGTYHFR